MLIKIEENGGDYGQEGINYFLIFWGGIAICDVSMSRWKVLMMEMEIFTIIFYIFSFFMLIFVTFVI